MTVLAIFASITETKKEADSEVLGKSELQHIPYIYYQVQFRELFTEALIDLGSKYNAM